jgi:hypothetical protein
VRTFRYLTPGRARLLLLANSSPQFHLEEIDIPASGLVERVVRPRWQRFPME